MSAYNSPSVAAPLGSPISSLGDLKSRHRDLLEQSDALEKTADFTRAVNGFLTAGTALGKTLSLPSERAEAQRILDFWASSRGPAGEHTSSPIRAAMLEPYADVGDSEAAQAARKMIEGLGEADRAIAKRLFLRLVQLEADGISFTPITRHESLLIDGADPEKARPILAGFKECGLIVPRENSWSLRGSGLFSYWKEAREWLSQRRRLRDAARFWEVHNCDENALLDGGEVLEEAAGYLDLNELERRFVKASTARREEREKRKGRILRRWITLLAALCIALIACLWWALSERAKAVSERAEAIRQREIAEQKQKLAEAKQKAYEELLTESTRERQRLEEQWRRKYEAANDSLVSTLDQLADTTQLPQADKTQLSKLVQTIEQRAPTQDIKPDSTSGVMEPGAAVLVQSAGENRQGTAGFFLESPATKDRYLVGPRSLLAGEAQAPSRIYRIARFGDIPNEQALIASGPVEKDPKGSPEALVAAQLKPEVKVRNVIPSVGAVQNIISPQDAVAQEVSLLGQGSGLRRGKVLRFDARSGLLITTRISTVGDSGAPVVSKDGKAVGILVGSNSPDESRVSPLAPFLEQSGLGLLSTHPPANPGLTGALVQLIISETQKNLLPRMERLLQALRDDGVQLPDGEVLLRKRTPSEQTEVRYYHPDDLKVAEAVSAQLHDLLGLEARISSVHDDSAPNKMIQVAFSTRDLERAFRSE